jgi:hypothetical protein
MEHHQRAAALFIRAIHTHTHTLKDLCFLLVAVATARESEYGYIDAQHIG